MLDIESSSLLDLIRSECLATNPGLDEQLKEIEDECERSGKSALEIIENFGLFARQDLLQLMAQSLGTVVWTPGDDIPRDVVERIDVSTARSYGVIPTAVEEDGTLHLAVRNALDYQTVESLRFVLGCNIIPEVIDPDDYDEQIDKYYPEFTEDFGDIIADLNQATLESSGREMTDEDRANDAPIVKFVDMVIMQGVRDKASDIHFEPFEKDFRIRYRVDGALYEMPPPPKSLAIPVISRIKIISGLNISERRKPQDGRIELKVNGKPVDLRVSCLPTSYGESVVLRVLDRSVVNLSLDALGIHEQVLKTIRELIHLPNGILLVTGPTGSGKTTTLYSALDEINKIEDKLLTAEDPVEYDIEGIIQVPINEAVGMTFDKALRAFLRQDPDRILVGEIRDFTTAQIAVEASLTGHFVFSTLHTNSAASTVTRLVDMGVEPFLICSSLSAVLAQRLIRRVCKNCMAYYTPTESDLERLGITREYVGDNKFCYGKGCQLCNQTGYKGRKALTELLVVNSEIRELIYENAPASTLQEKAREMGMFTLREDGLRAIMNHETSVDEVIRYT